MTSYEEVQRNGQKQKDVACSGVLRKKNELTCYYRKTFVGYKTNAN
jgi:hypothetical protein